MLCTLFNTGHAQEAALVGVASNLELVIPHLKKSFEEKTGLTLRISISSSGALVHKIENGAPYALIIVADSRYARRASNKREHALPVAAITRARLAFFLPKQHDCQIGKIRQALYRDRYLRIAIANPNLAPFGGAALEALSTIGAWAIDKNRLIVATNAIQASQFVRAHAVDLGLIPHDHAQLLAQKKIGCFVNAPKDWYQPLLQYAVLIKPDNLIATAFYKHLTSAAAKSIFLSHGFFPVRS